jgi:hypothetical protein
MKNENWMYLLFRNLDKTKYVCTCPDISKLNM